DRDRRTRARRYDARAAAAWLAGSRTARALQGGDDLAAGDRGTARVRPRQARAAGGRGEAQLRGIADPRRAVQSARRSAASNQRQDRSVGRTAAVAAA